MSSKDVKTQKEKRVCTLCTISSYEYMTIFSKETMKQIDDDFGLDGSLVGKIGKRTRIYVCGLCLRTNEKKQMQTQLDVHKMNTLLGFVSHSVDVPPDEPVNWVKLLQDDPPYMPQTDDDEGSGEEGLHDEIRRHHPRNVSIQKRGGRMVLMELAQLEALLEDVLTVCKHCICTITNYKIRTVSTCAEVVWSCGCDKKPGRSPKFPNRWTSQKPMSPHPQEQLYEGNVAIGVAVLVNGLSYQKMCGFGRDIGLSLPPSTIHYSQRKLLISPVLESYFQEKQAEHFSMVLQESASVNGLDSDGRIKLGLCGDGQHDCMGHCAGVMRYLLMCALTTLIIDYRIVLRTDPGIDGISPRMEAAGFKDIISRWNEGTHEEDDFAVDFLVTDKHMSIGKIMREQYGQINHQLDKWHLIKNWRKCLLQIVESMKNKQATKLMMLLLPSLTNHFWFALEKADGDGDLAIELLFSMVLHLQGIHTQFDEFEYKDNCYGFEFTRITECLHAHANYVPESIDEEEFEELECDPKQQEKDTMFQRVGEVEEEERVPVLNVESLSTQDMPTFLLTVSEESQVEEIAENDGDITCIDMEVEAQDDDQPTQVSDSFTETDAGSHAIADPEPERAYLRREDHVHHTVLRAIVQSLTSPTMQKNIRRCSPKFTTSAIELANSLQTGVYTPKRVHIGSDSYRLLTMCTILDWNEKATCRLEEERARERAHQLHRNHLIAGLPRDTAPELPPPKKRSKWTSKALKKMKWKSRNKAPQHLFRLDIMRLVLEHVREKQLTNKRNQGLRGSDGGDDFADAEEEI